MKRLIGYGLSLLLIIFLVLPAAAAEPRVIDEAGLLTNEEVDGLEEQIAALCETYPNMDFVFVTTDDTQGKDTQAYADDYYDFHGYGAGGNDSGVLFLIDMDNRNLGISTHADGVRYFTDERIEALLDRAYGYVSGGDYAGAAKAFLDGAEEYMKTGIPSDQHNYDTETGKITREKNLSVQEIVIFALIAVAAGVVCCVVVFVRYRKKADRNSYPFREKSEMNLTRSEDVFINQTVTRRRINSNPPSGGSRSSGGFSGRSSTHTSSSGRTHGGGTRRF